MWRFVCIVGTTMLLAACGGGGDNSTPTPSGPTPPSALNYQSPETALVGQAISLTASVSGSVTSYAVSPALPAGLSINATTGVISGTPSSVSAKATYTVTASNSGGGTTFAWVLTVNPAAPTALSYSTPPPFLVGKAIASVTPTVTGTVTSYTVAPALPAGLAIDVSAGVISGTPSAVATSATYTVTASNVTGSTIFGLTLRIDPAPTVHLSATATDAQGNPLTYQWKTTDGVLLNVNGAQADWMLPPGPGVHFAYVLVSNGKGGYTERRILVATDDIGNPALTPASVSFDAPPAPAPSGGNYFRSFARQDASVFLQNDQTNAVTASIATDVRGFFTIPMVPPGAPGLNYHVPCSAFGGQGIDTCGHFEIRNEASQELLSGASPWADFVAGVAGLVTLVDGSSCGTVNEFFGKEATAHATLLDAGNNVVGGPIRVNAFGNYQLLYVFGGPAPPSLASVRVECEHASPTTFPASFGFDAQGFICCSPVVISDSAPVLISTITATYNGNSTGMFTPPPMGLPSDAVRGSDQFLGYKGIDSRVSAWQYYLAIGAIKGYDPSRDVVTGAISFDDWKRKVKIDPYAAAGQHDVVATYVNKVDLNLTRVHHSISYGPGGTAAYVCNHLGPTDDSQGAIETAIDNASKGRNQVACVAMDYSVTSGVNADQPFTRFLIFGPSGQLLPSVNLDGRTEKFIPGTCVVCHGGDRYAGSFPADGTGSADIGAHFLPYDIGNFEFSTTPGLTLADQQLAIYLLNQNVLNAGPTVAEQELIAGWYAGGTHTLDTTYLPVSWQGQSSASVSFYQNVYSRRCRTCHVALTEALNLDHYSNITTKVGSDIGRDRILYSVCSQGPTANGRSRAEVGVGSHDAGAMPNSLRTYNLFWGSAGTVTDEPKIIGQYLSEQYFLPIGCSHR